MGYRYSVLSLLLIGWCALHSLLISLSVTSAFRKRLGAFFRFYRLFYNFFAALTLVPVALYAYSVRTEPIFAWHGYWRILQLVLLVASGVLFVLGARQYDAGQFLGLKQIQTGDNGGGITDTGRLDTSGILSVVRHPWYLAGILLVWTRELDASTILVNSIFCAYFVVGAFLEERKLTKEFGEQFRGYQKRVSMLFPYKFFKSFFHR